MLYDYKEAIAIYGNDYNLKKAILDKRIFKIEKGIYSDGKSNFNLIELIMKKYKHAFLVKESALYLIGFINEKPEKIHIGTARNALRIKDDRIQQHFYSNLDLSVLRENDWCKYTHFLSYENIQKYHTENNNEIRLFNLKALFFDIVRRYKDFSKSDLLTLLDKFKNSSYFYGLTESELEENLQYENIINDIDFFYPDIYEKLMEVLSEVWDRDFKMKYDL